MRQEIQIIADRISHDKMGFDKRIKFCPSCGVQSLMRSDRLVDPYGKQIPGKEYWCAICGFSFNIRASIEWNLALRLFKESRKSRNGQYRERDMDPEVMKIWLKMYAPRKSKSGTWSLADKLKSALGIK